MLFMSFLLLPLLFVAVTVAAVATASFDNFLVVGRWILIVATCCKHGTTTA